VESKDFTGLFVYQEIKEIPKTPPSKEFAIPCGEGAGYMRVGISTAMERCVRSKEFFLNSFLINGTKTLYTVLWFNRWHP